MRMSYEEWLKSFHDLQARCSEDAKRCAQMEQGLEDSSLQPGTTYSQLCWYKMELANFINAHAKHAIPREKFDELQQMVNDLMTAQKSTFLLSQKTTLSHQFGRKLRSLTELTEAINTWQNRLDMAKRLENQELADQCRLRVDILRQLYEEMESSAP